MRTTKIHKSDKEAGRLRSILGWYNMVPNVFWSAICLVPLTVFCYSLLPLSWFLAFLVLSGVPVFLPNTFFDRIPVGKTTTAYKRLGVEVVNRLAQNGYLFNRQIRKRFPAYRTVTANRNSVHKRIRDTYVYGKFHFLLFVFFFLCMVYALVQAYYGRAAVLFITNIVYDVYPNLLQPYKRLKLKVQAGRQRAVDVAPLARGR